MTMKILQTVSGPVPIDELGLILPHEHLFTDLRGPHIPGYATGDPQKVATVIRPYLHAAYEAGVTALVECSTLGVGRNITVLKRLSEETPVRIVAPTGVYREAYTPAALREVKVDQLAQNWIQELQEGIDGTTIKAGFIKIAVSDDGPTELEIRNIRAAARASLVTGAVIASHTIPIAAALLQMEILEQEGLDLHRFIWVHAQVEAREVEHLEAVRRGAYIEFDSVGAPFQDQNILLAYTLALVNAGYAEHILVSHDAGWYDPSQPDGLPPGDGIRGYTGLIDSFIPALRTRGLSEEMIRLLTHTNPARAFGMEAI